MKQTDMESIKIIEGQLNNGYLDMAATIYKPEIDLIRKMVEEYKANHKNDLKGE